MRHPAFVRMLTMVLAAALTSSCAVAQVTVTERSMLPGSPGAALTSADVASVAPLYVMEQHSVPASDGTRLNATLLQLPGASLTVLYFGGNAYQSGRHGPRTAAVFASLGVNVMILDKRGYGPGEGEPTVANIQTDGATAFDYLVNVIGLDSNHIVVHGQSVGSVVAGYVAANRPTAGVVLESAVTTADEWVAAQSESRPLLRVELAESLRGVGVSPFMGRIEEPVLLLVGAEDRTTPPSFSVALAGAAPATTQTQLVIVPNAGHNDAMQHPEAMSAYQTLLDHSSSGD